MTRACSARTNSASTCSRCAATGARSSSSSLLPLILLVAFVGLFGTDTVEVAGQQVEANRASVPGVMGLAVLTSSFMALVMAVVSQREDGHPQAPPRRRRCRRGARDLARA